MSETSQSFPRARGRGPYSRPTLAGDHFHWFNWHCLKGKSIPVRARPMISIAHPDFRDELERQARGHGLIPKGFF